MAIVACKSEEELDESRGSICSNVFVLRYHLKALGPREDLRVDHIPGSIQVPLDSNSILMSSKACQFCTGEFIEHAEEEPKGL